MCSRVSTEHHLASFLVDFFMEHDDELFSFLCANPKEKNACRQSKNLNRCWQCEEIETRTRNASNFIDISETM